MATFTDTSGTVRTIEINPVTLDRIQQRFGLDLMDTVNGDLAHTLLQDAPLLMNIVGELAFPGMDDAEAVQLLASNDVIENSVDALTRAIIDNMPAMTAEMIMSRMV